MPNTKHKKQPTMATAPPKRKTAMDTLLENMDELAVSAAERMTTEEVRQVRKNINDVVDRAVDRKPRRETA
jgi:RNA-splicing ligase RtcB